MAVGDKLPETFDMKVKRCFFHDFFARHDVPLLTTIMCAFDQRFASG
jgi:L-2-amino-thiazoline-4-carboxylic acid hydrolase